MPTTSIRMVALRIAIMAADGHRTLATPRDSTTTATVARSRHTNDSRHPIAMGPEA